ncbi:MFS transporter [Planomonospora sp. ID67723]|uniref:MFS transporter n=1 Tax=Planomonospora sp. ID67723 TaxID=2738134 RepID=UPI0018C434EE|nr:MFS transporter [Planomonospora sp. ID67723]MBG0830886.1 MFS transporter [Planomonospora sp. ID67723]
MTATQANTDLSPMSAPAVTAVQRRTLGVLTAAQITSGMGVAVGFTLSSVVVTKLSGSEAIGGLAGTATVLGAALFALPTAKAAGRGGRRTGLTLAYTCAILGCLITVLAITAGSWPLLLAGLVLFGSGSAGNLASRYSATDLSPPGHSARHLSWVVWAATIGSVAGPNLAGPADGLGRRFGLADYTGPFVLALLAFALALGIIMIGMRPDPLVLARSITGSGPGRVPRSGAAPGTGAAPDDGAAVDDGAAAVPAADLKGTEPAVAPEDGSPLGPVKTGTAKAEGALRAAWRSLRESPAALRALAAIAVSHTAMVSIMSMTPIHLDHHGAGVTVIGLVISLHVVGMYVLSPVVGWLADRIGRVQVLVLGMALLLAAAVLAGTAGEHGVPQVTAGLVLLGLGWSCGLVSGSAMLTESVPLERRPAVQGLSDLVMNACGATGTVAAGVIVETLSYGTLGTAVAVMVTAAGVWLVLRR